MQRKVRKVECSAGRQVFISPRNLRTAAVLGGVDRMLQTRVCDYVCRRDVYA